MEIESFFKEAVLKVQCHKRERIYAYDMLNYVALTVDKVSVVLRIGMCLVF